MTDKFQRVPYYCALEYGQSMHDPRFGAALLAIVWRYGGCINGSAQPFKIEHILSDQSETRVRVMVEESFPGIEYAPVPQVIDGRVYP